MPLSTFTTTLLLQGFDVSFSPNINDEDAVQSINVVIKKNDISVQRIANIPKVTTGYGIDDLLLYKELKIAYDKYNRIGRNSRQRSEHDS